MRNCCVKGGNEMVILFASQNSKEKSGQRDGTPSGFLPQNNLTSGKVRVSEVNLV